MNFSGRPLLDNHLDAALFVGRESELGELYGALSNGLNVLVSGDPGSGKTSLLRALMYRSRTREQVRHSQLIGDFDFTYIRAEGFQQPSELLERIFVEVVGEPYAPDQPFGRLLQRMMQAREDAVGATQARWEAREPGLGSSPVTSVIVVDDVSAAAGHGLFGLLRDELWGLGFVWVVAVRTADRGALLLPPADAFFERRVDVGPLDAAAARDLVTRRTGSSSGEWPVELLQAVGGNPRRLLEVARDVVGRPGGPTYQEVRDAIAQRDAAVHALGRPESMLVAELGALGAASASDAALLDRLGWTRGRAAQVFARLEEAGLVVSEEVRTGGQGRPRKVFRLRPAAEYVAALDDAAAQL